MSKAEQFAAVHGCPNSGESVPGVLEPGMQAAVDWLSTHAQYHDEQSKNMQQTDDKIRAHRRKRDEFAGVCAHLKSLVIGLRGET